MKKLISILTLASFSLVPTTNIIAFENGQNSDDEIVGKTIAQEIVDGAIDEVQTTITTELLHIKGVVEYLKSKDIVSNFSKYPEAIPMMSIIGAFENFMEKHNFVNTNYVSKLNLLLNINTSQYKMLEQNLKKFKVISANKNKNWFNDVQKVIGSDKPKKYEFHLKFGKTLSKKTISLNMYWDSKKD